jgi:hypothetical protein
LVDLAYARNFTIGAVKNKPFFISSGEKLEVYGNFSLAIKNICFFYISRIVLKGSLKTNTLFSKFSQDDLISKRDF